MKDFSRTRGSVALSFVSLLFLAMCIPGAAQEERGTVKTDSLPVYSEMSRDSEVVSTLAAGTVVRISLSITNGDGSWCSIAAIDDHAKLGYVRCDGLERQNAPSTAASPGGAATQSFSAGSRSYTRAQREWALAASAILATFNREPMNTLASGGPSPDQRRNAQRLIRVWWGIGSREDLLTALVGIEQGGHRMAFSAVGSRVEKLSPEDLKKIVSGLSSDGAHSVVIAHRYYDKLGSQSITAWDFARYINLCRWGVESGYLSEDEAWPRVMYAAGILQQTFSSWREFSEDYLIGREFWSLRQTKIDGQVMRAICQRLLNDPNSPWNRIPWNLPLQ